MITAPKLPLLLPALLVYSALSWFCGWVEAADCVQWIKRTDVGSYGQRYQHAMAYDHDRGVTVFFGGEIGTRKENTTYFNDTQEYDGKQWKQILTAVKPPKRSGHSMVYDPVRKKIVLFGGSEVIPATGFDTERIFNDTWLYSGDGVNGFWVLQQDTNPPPRVGHQMIWDSAALTVLVHGGRSRNSTADTGTWFWGGAEWFRLVSGPSVSDFGMVFDTGRSVAMIAGGFTGTDEQSRTANVWEQGPGGGWANRGPGPSSRAQLTMAYDERRKRTVMVGGVGESVETGETAFEFIGGTGWLTLPSLPSGQGRAGAKMVYDSKRGVMVLTGGAGGGAPNAGSGGRYSDTWELSPSLLISSHPSNVTNVVCTTATFSVLAFGAAPFQYTWRLDGVPLTDDAHFSGSRTAELQVNGLRHTHAGNYDVVIHDSCTPPNELTSKTATLTIKPEMEWVLRSTEGPSPRFGHAMVYDSKRRVTVLLGGRTNWNAINPVNDLWEWDGARWTLRMSGTITNGWTNVPGLGWQVAHRDRPVQRTYHAMAYDSRRGRVVVFGGQGIDPGGSSPALKDLWEWDGTHWHFRTTNGPISRVHGSMAYDPRRGRTVLFGGQSYAPGTPDDNLVWEWDGDRWHTNAPLVTPAGAGSRNQARMTYDSFRGVTVFGPTYENYSFWSFWDWDGDKWSNFPVVHFTDPIVTVLHGTISGGFAFDANRRRSLWFGGAQGGPANHTAFYDGKHWALLANSAAPPAKRLLPAMAYDSDRLVTVMFGGSLTLGDALGATNDTWELIAVDVPLINEHPASQYRLLNDAATFSVKVAQPVSVSYQWYHDDAPIPGAQSSTFTIPSVRAEDSGEYRVSVANLCGETRSRSALLTLNPSLQVYTSANTTTLIWQPDPAVVLESSDAVNGPWTIISDPPNPFTIGGGPAKFFRHRRTE